MRDRFSRWASLSFHTFVVALFPLGVLVVRHARDLPLDTPAIARASGLLAFGTGVSLYALRLRLADLETRAVVLSCWVFLLWIYPTFSLALGRALVGTLPESLTAVAYLGVSPWVALAVGRRLVRDRSVHILNGVALLLVVLVVGGLFAAFRPWSRPSWSPAVEAVRRVAQEGQLTIPHDPPDVYYIVLDGMSGPTVMADVYGADVRAFVSGLLARRFVLVPDARSNYSQTHLSLASSLNMAYLDPLAEVLVDSSDRRPLWELVHGGGVADRLRQAGYEFVVVGSDYSLTSRHGQADRCECHAVRGLTELESALLETTPFRAFVPDALTFGAHRRHVLSAFDSIERVERRGRPMFIKAHILAPHPPFVFRADGSGRAQRGAFAFLDGSDFGGGREAYREGYREQATYIMSRLLMLADRLEARPGRHVVILQGDHGGGLGLDQKDPSRTDARERLSILLAVRTPPPALALPAFTTPVNVFRLVFNHLFDASYERLEDRSFLSSFVRPYDLMEVPR